MSSVYQLKRKELANDVVRFFSDKNNAKKDVAYLVSPKIVSNNVASGRTQGFESPFYF